MYETKSRKMCSNILLMSAEKIGYKFIRCLVHENRVRSFAVMESHICFGAFGKIFFCFETITV